MLVDTLKYFHEEIKMQIKLTWDSSYFEMKGTEILGMLKRLSEYHEVMEKYIKSVEFILGMK